MLGGEFFIYMYHVDAVAATAEQKATISIDSGKDFVCSRIAASFYQTATVTDLASYCGLQISHSGRYNLFSDQVRLNLLINTLMDPFIFPEPYRFTGGSSISLTIKNNHASLAADVKILFIGEKVPMGS